MIITTGRSRKDTQWRARECDWSWLCSHLSGFRRTPETMRQYKAMNREEQSRAKDVGGFVGGRLSGPRRTNLNVISRCLVTLDADHAYKGQWEDVTAIYEDRMLCYSTHSSTPENPRLRFVIPLDREVSPEEYGAVARKLAERIGIDTMDPTTYAVERLMYWPSCPCDAEPEFHVQEGPVVCADKVLLEYGGGDQWRDTTLWPIGKAEQEIRIRERKIAGEPTEKPGIIGLFCRCYDVPGAIETFLPEVYREAGPGRYTYAGGSTFGGAVVYSNGAFLYSNHATDPASCQLLNAFDLVRVHLFGELDAGKEAQEVQRRPSYKAMCELASEDGEVKRQLVRERLGLLSDIGAMEGGEEKSLEKEADSDDTQLDKTDAADWVTELEVNSKTGALEQTIRNAELIIRNDPELKGAFAINEMHQSIVIRSPVPWRAGKQEIDPRNGSLLTEADNSGMRAYMERRWRFTDWLHMKDARTNVSQENSFHPVREYLTGLTWDGEERLDTMLIRYMAAEDNAYVRAVTRKWMCAAVARAMTPGCKYDNMLVLSGRQGIGKSTLPEILSRGWFTASLNRLTTDRDALSRLRGIWIAEVAEMSAYAKSSMEEVKNYLSITVDRYRPAYAEFDVAFPRTCVFYGSVNDTEFLRDSTGNRRFWVVQVPGVGHGELPGLREEVDQLWAEAVVRWQEGESLWLDTKELQDMAAEEAEAAMIEDDMYYRVKEYIDTTLPADWYELSLEDRRNFFNGIALRKPEECTMKREYVCNAELVNEMLCMDETRLDAGLKSRVTNALRRLQTEGKWQNMGKRTRRVPGYGSPRKYWSRVA